MNLHDQPNVFFFHLFTLFQTGPDTSFFKKVCGSHSFLVQLPHKNRTHEEGKIKHTYFLFLDLQIKFLKISSEKVNTVTEVQTLI